MAATSDAQSTEPTAPTWAPDLLIYAPGLPHFATNTADAVADVVAATLDRRREGRYRATVAKVPAPRGLRAAKTVLGPDDQPVLDVFELDYRDRMADSGATPKAGGAPGALRSVGYGVGALLKLVVAWRRPGKTKRAKLQLALGLAGALALIAVGAAGLVAFAAAQGWLGSPPSWVPELGDNGPTAGAVAAASGGVVVTGWAAVRRRARLLAQHVQETMRYLNADRHRDTVTMTLDDAVDGLRDIGWTGRIHVLGYSFGSLVAVDALIPRADGDTHSGDRFRGAVKTLTTVGCPADAVRLFYPKYFETRQSRVPRLRWTNVFIAADVFGSNLAGDDDADVVPPDAVTKVFQGVVPTSRRYTEEQLSYRNALLAKGFRMHGGYWDLREEASCFSLVVDDWVPPHVVNLVPEQPKKPGRGSRASEHV
jgi:hypothetical protein